MQRGIVPGRPPWHPHAWKEPLTYTLRLLTFLRQSGKATASFLLISGPSPSARSYPMNIDWRDDIDGVLTDAKAQNRNVLLDFSAAPM